MPSAWTKIEAIKHVGVREMHMGKGKYVQITAR